MNRARWYLETLPAWDGVPRIERVFKKPSNARKFAAFLHDAIARTFRPGCLLARVLVIQGPQGTRKSMFLRALASEELYHDLGELPAASSIPRDAWVAEWSELTEIPRCVFANTKDLLAGGYYRAPGDTAVTTARAFVLCGTTSEPAFHERARVSRRFRVIRTRVKLPVNFVVAHRDQLWAEALHRYRLWAEALHRYQTNPAKP